MRQREVVCINIITSAILCLATLMFLLNMEKFVDIGLPSPVSPLEFPYFISAFLLIASAIYFCSSLLAFYKSRSVKKNETINKSGDDAEHEDDRLVACVVYIAILYMYYFLICLFGFIIATPVTMLAVSVILGAKNYRVLIPSYIAFSLLMHFTALKLMKIDLPAGILF